MVSSAQELLVKAFSKESPEDLFKLEQECLPEMELHLQMYPLDYNFTVNASEPGVGYGTLICMEESCFCEIKLDPSFKAPGGGIKRGFGGLSAYWNHIRDSPAHVSAREARIETQAKQTASSPAVPKNALKAHHSGLSSEMDRLDASGSRPRSKPTSSASLPGGASTPTVPKKRASLKGHSSAGVILTDNEDLVDKKPRLGDVKPDIGGVLADRGNASPPPRASTSKAGGADSAEIEQLRSLEAKKAKYEGFLAELRALSKEDRESNHFDEIDKINAKIGRIDAAINVWVQQNGPRPAQAPQQQPQQQPQGGGGAGGGGIAGGTGWHVDEEVRRLFQMERLRNPGGSDAMADIMQQLSGGALPGGGAAPASDDGSVDPADEFAGIRANGRMPRAGPAGQDFHDFVSKAIEGESFEGNANVDGAAAALGLKSQHQCVPNMTVSLMPHQLIGVAWMKAQEQGERYGGILADEMGLGKTIESIALMCANESRDPEEKSTLIVAPLALLEQWKEEIEEKTKDGYFSILIYHGPDRKKMKLKHLKKYDVVLTTYSTLVLDYGDDEGAQKKARQKAKKEGGSVDDYFEFQEDGPLLQMSWYRIILDEAQNIRNRQTKVSRAVAGVDALFRWCLTGTPVTNSLADLFPLFRFIQIKPWYNWPDYNEHVVKHEKLRGDLAGKRAQVILRTTMLRRKKDSKLDGKELISLPEKTVQLLSLEFSEEEREIYESVEKKAQIKFKKMLRAGTVLKNYSHVLVMLLRLRQICFHPCLIADLEGTLEKKEERKELVKNELKRASKEVGPEFVRKMKAERFQAAVARMKAETNEAGDEAENLRSDECSICLEDVLTTEAGGVATRCSHVFCKACIVETINQPLVEDEGDEASVKCKKDQRPCPICRSPVGEKDIFALEAFEPSDLEVTEKLGMQIDEEMDEDDDDEGDNLNGFIVPDDEDEDDEDSGRRVQKKKKAAKQPNRAVIQDSDDDEDLLLVSEAEEDFASESRSKKDKGKGKGKVTKAEAKKIRSLWMKEQVPSTKMKWVKNELERLFKEDPDDKVIVISSFTSMLDLMQDYLDESGIKTCRYQGDMNATERQQSLKVLKKSKKCKVMLLSLRSGGVGLTLTRANRVISLDLAWSYAVEAQAYDRTHRIGQTKKVYVQRLTIADTVEKRIFDLQEKKQGLADASLGEGKAQRLAKLTVAELGALFGL